MTDSHYAHPEYLVETEWLEDHLSDPDLRIFDCTVLLALGADGAYSIDSGRPTYDAGHIPGAGFIDINEDLSDKSQALRFMLPPADQFAAQMSAVGVEPGTRVVLYSTNMAAWATRLWWMLRANGFDQVAVLNGGWAKWQAEGRPISTEPADYPLAQFEGTPRPELVADMDRVKQAIGADDTCILNALPAAMYGGEMAAYGRPGHIATSVNIPTVDLEDPATNTFLPADALRKKFEDAGVLAADQVITYCGGGIAATHDAFALALIGRDDVAVYDASLSEWAMDPDAPMEVG